MEVYHQPTSRQTQSCQMRLLILCVVNLHLELEQMLIIQRKGKEKRTLSLPPCDNDQQQQEEMAVNGCKAPKISFSAENKRYRVAREQS